MSESNKLFAIRNKESGEYWKSKGGKTGWGSKAAAKNAWANTYKKYRYREDFEVERACGRGGVKPVPHPRPTNYYGLSIDFPYFDQQDTWEIVDMGGGTIEETGALYKQAKELLKDCLVYDLPEDLVTKIEEFLDAK